MTAASQTQNDLLWFDDTPDRTLEEKVKRAVARFSSKFGIAPNVCRVHACPLCATGAGDVRKTISTVPDSIDGVRIVPLRRVLPNHFEVGVEVSARTDKARLR
jgi:hypothetical protein